MKTIISSVILFSILVFSTAFSQNDVHASRDFMEAVKKGTRTLTGQPGEKYWTNHSDYNISVTVDPASNTLTGEESITYYNNSPDTLNSIFVRLYNNIYRSNASRNFQMRCEQINDGVEISYISVNDIEYDIKNNDEVRESGTNLRLLLKENLNPKSKMHLVFKWKTIVPNRGLRSGFYDSTTAFIAYWYPQISVYDDIDGWDQNQYHGYAEMYNEFNNFNVEITVPNNFGVWATGLLQNPSDILNEKYLERFDQAHISDEVINIITEEDVLEANIFKGDKENLVYKFRASNTPDFAFGLSDYYLWDAVSVNVNKSGDDRVIINAAYNPKSKDFYDVAEIARKTIVYFSEEMPGYPYPFPAATVFNGSGGMEFPMIVNDGSTQSYSAAVGLTSHELAHQYMPFYLGTNERKYAWMDEGWAVMLPFDLQARYDSGKRNTNVAEVYSSLAGREVDVPPLVLSNQLYGTTYRLASYGRSGLAYDFLRDFLGDDLFKKALNGFIETWNNKHPLPNDFFNIFNSTVGENLSWFWKPWFEEFGYPDLGIKNVLLDGNKLSVTIQKIGKIPVPIHLKVVEADENVIEIYKTCSVWKSGESEIKLDIDLTRGLKRIELGTEQIPDAHPQDNLYQVE